MHEEKQQEENFGEISWGWIWSVRMCVCNQSEGGVLWTCKGESCHQGQGVCATHTHIHTHTCTRAVVHYWLHDKCWLCISFTRIVHNIVEMKRSSADTSSTSSLLLLQCVGVCRCLCVGECVLVCSHCCSVLGSVYWCV